MDTFERVKQWNRCCSKYPEEVGTAQYWQSLANQAERIKEELQELYEAINSKDIEGVVDAGADLDVVVSGLNYLSGSDYSSVINAVLDNNDLKFTPLLEKVHNWLQYHLDNGVDAFIDESLVDENGLRVYCVKRKEDDKVLKYGNFPKVDITPYLPEPVEEKFVLIQDSSQLEEVKDKYDEYEVLTLDTLEGDHIDFFDSILEEHNNVILTICNGSLTSIDTLGGE